MMRMRQASRALRAACNRCEQTRQLTTTHGSTHTSSRRASDAGPPKPKGSDQDNTPAFARERQVAREAALHARGQKVQFPRVPSTRPVGLWTKSAKVM
jgi:hypothetical protein